MIHFDSSLFSLLPVHSTLHTILHSSLPCFFLFFVVPLCLPRSPVLTWGWNYVLKPHGSNPECTAEFYPFKTSPYSSEMIIK